MDIKKTLSEMSLKEKIGQLSQNLYGWDCYEIKDGEIFLTDKFKEEVNKYDGLGFLYGLMRSDPWSGRNYNNGITKELSQQAVKLVNDYIEKNTRLKIPVVFVEEAPHGHQALDSSLMPVNMTISNSWNPELVKEYYSYVGKEMAARGVHVALVSVFDVLRDARWGRSEECFSEDPILSAAFGKAVVDGIQSSDNFGAVAKHYIAQGSNIGGRNADGVLIGERELNEIHLYPAKEILNAENKPFGIMVAYNHIDGIYCHANPKLLKTLLRDKWMYDGITMSDGTAIDNLVKQVGTDAKAIGIAIDSGVDVDLWNKTFNSLEEAVENGFVSEVRIDEAVERVLLMKEKLGLFSERKYNEIPSKIEKTTLEEESMVLLSNDGILPISNISSLAILGPHTENIYSLLGDYTPFQDGLTLEKTMAMEFKELWEGVKIVEAIGSKFNNPDKSLNEAIELAKKTDAVIITLGSTSGRDFNTKFLDNGAAVVDNDSANEMDSGENMDKATLEVSEHQLNLVKEIYKVNKNIILFFSSGRPMAISELEKYSRSMIWSGFPGPRAAKALWNLITGKANFSGKLAYTLPSATGYETTWYNWRDHKQYVDVQEPKFKFGYGLSYSGFEYSKPVISEGVLSFTIKNISDFDGQEIIQIYTTKLDGLIVPRNLQLSWFKKVSIKAREQHMVKIKVSEILLDEYKNDFEYSKPNGSIRVSIGTNIDSLQTIIVNANE